MVGEHGTWDRLKNDHPADARALVSVHRFPGEHDPSVLLTRPRQLRSGVAAQRHSQTVFGCGYPAVQNTCRE